MRHKLRQGPERPLITMLRSGAVLHECRSDLVGAQPGPGSGRPPRPAIQRVQVRARRPGQSCRAGGSGAFPSVATLVRYTGLSERTVRTCLDRLEAGGIIRPCDPDLLAARIKRADRRPQGWDLDLTLARDDLNEPGVTVPESQSPVRRAGLAPIERPHHERPPNGVQPPHPAGLVDHLDHEVQQSHLAAATRCNQRTGGVQPTRPRGAAVAPEPSTESSLKPSAASGPTHHAAAVGGRGGPADKFFAALPDAWMLTGEQRATLSPAAETALSSGWSACRAQAAFTGANTEGVRSPFAVLTARLSPAELQASRRPGGAGPEPPWCGQCDQATGCSASTATRAPVPALATATASRASPAPPLARARPRSSAPPLYCGHRL